MLSLIHGHNRKISHCLQNHFGFTFAEMLASILFIAIVIPITLEGIIIANRAGVIANRKRIAVEHADVILSDLIINNEWQNGFPNGIIGSNNDYQWSLEKSQWDKEDLQLLTIHVSFKVQEKVFEVSLSTIADASGE